VTIADDLKALLYTHRGLPGTMGLRPHSVAIVTTTYSGPHTGEGTKTETVTPVVESGNQNPKVRWLSDKELAAGGYVEGGVIEIGPITPSTSTVGTDIADLLASALEDGDMHHLRITGPRHPSGARYRVTALDPGKALRYMVKAVPVR
jgi:hypothetical protein